MCNQMSQPGAPGFSFILAWALFWVWVWLFGEGCYLSVSEMEGASPHKPNLHTTKCYNISNCLLPFFPRCPL